MSRWVQVCKHCSHTRSNHDAQGWCNACSIATYSGEMLNTRCAKTPYSQTNQPEWIKEGLGEP